MSKFLKLSGIALFVMFMPANAALAQAKIGTVDSDRLLTESQAGKSIVSGLENVGNAIKTQVTAPQAKLKSSEQSLKPLLEGKTQQQVASDPALLSRYQGFQRELGAYAQLEKRSAQEFSLSERKALSDFNKKAADAIEHVRNQKGLDIVFSNGQYVVASSKVDITTDVINRLNATAPSIAVSHIRMPEQTQRPAPR